jgi:photosystem II stability/assembly factor-like uncharacterized protein
MDAAVRCLVVLAAGLLVGAAAGARERQYVPVSLGPGRIGVLEQTDVGSRLLLAPSWSDLTPPRMPGWIDDVEFVDRRTGWLAASDCVAASGLVARTLDGGRTWRRLTGRFFHTCNAGATLDLDFVDRRNGWLTWREPSGRFHELHRTRDGGRTWRLVRQRHADGGAEQVTFTSARAGWGVGAPPPSTSGPLLRTTNGGRTWAAEPDVPEGFQALPVFRGRNGVAAVASPGGDVEVHATRDGGATWTRATRLAVPGRVRHVALDSPARGVWWVAVEQRRRLLLWVTRDAGRRWTRTVHEPSLEFVALTGWTAWGSRDGTLLRTDDAGRTWRRVTVG